MGTIRQMPSHAGAGRPIESHAPLGTGTPRLNGICAYYTMFPLDFPLRRLREAHRGAWVLDPFCGRGTTNLAARMCGLPSVGIDSSPVAVAIAQAKLSGATSSRVIDSCRKILAAERVTSVPHGEFWELCYHPETLLEICRVRDALLKSSRSEARISLRALMLGLLHGPLRKGPPAHLSNQMPRTYATKPDGAVRYWRKRGMLPPRVPLFALVQRRAPFYLDRILPRINGEVLRWDSRGRIDARIRPRFSHVITSPPYVAMDHYLRDQWLRNWFVGGPARPTWNRHNALLTDSPDQFVAEMGRVWSSVGAVCKRGARLTVRFGSIPGKQINPTNVITASLDASDCDWRILTVTDAGPATQGRRQSDQFLNSPRNSLREVDVHAVLRNN